MANTLMVRAVAAMAEATKVLFMAPTLRSGRNEYASQQRYIDGRQKLSGAGVTFARAAAGIRLMPGLASFAARRTAGASPPSARRLPAGSRVNDIIRPLAIDGASLTIRR